MMNQMQMGFWDWISPVEQQTATELTSSITHWIAKLWQIPATQIAMPLIVLPPPPPGTAPKYCLSPRMRLRSNYCLVSLHHLMHDIGSKLYCSAHYLMGLSQSQIQIHIWFIFYLYNSVTGATRTRSLTMFELGINKNHLDGIENSLHTVFGIE